MSKLNELCQTSANTEAEQSVRPEDLARKSQLDYSLKEVERLKNTLKLSDKEKAKLDTYFEQLRAMELNVAASIERSKEGSSQESLPCPDFRFPDDLKTQQDRIRLSMDLLILAAQHNVTNVGTYMFGSAQANLSFSDLSIGNAWHPMTHSAKANDLAKLDKINEFCYKQVSYFISKLQSTEVSPGKTLFDTSAVLFSGGEVANPLNHSNKNMPFFVSGKAGDAIDLGRVVKLSSDNMQNSHANILLAMCQAMGIQTNSIGVKKWCGSPVKLKVG